MIWLILGGIWFICGLVGSSIAENKGASAGLGFTLGLLFGPIGLIVSAMLSPVKRSGGSAAASPVSGTPLKPPAEADLDDAQYKIWLIEAYSISKNEILGEYVCGKQSFKNVNDALGFAHSEEVARRASIEQNIIEREAERLAQEEIWIRKKAEEDANWLRNRPKVIFFCAIFIVFLSFSYWKYAIGDQKYWKGNREEKTNDHVLKQKILSFGIRLMDGAEDIKFIDVQFNDPDTIWCLGMPGEIVKYKLKSNVEDVVEFYDAALKGGRDRFYDTYQESSDRIYDINKNYKVELNVSNSKQFSVVTICKIRK